MAKATITQDQLTQRLQTALGADLVAVVLYGSAARPAGATGQVAAAASGAATGARATSSCSCAPSPRVRYARWHAPRMSGSPPVTPRP